MKDKVIVFFTRIPTLGKTKTRLESFLNRQLCVDLQTAFIKDIYENIRLMGIDILVSYSDHGDLSLLKSIVGEDASYLRQSGDGLGEKMYRAIDRALEDYKKVILIGSDLPLISRKDLDIAFEILEEKDLVIAPTYDGGYYLIGMKDREPRIFDIEYSTSSVFEETLGSIEGFGKSYGLGNIQLDIDDREDFLRLYRILRADKSLPCKNTRELVYRIMEGDGKNALG